MIIARRKRFFRGTLANFCKSKKCIIFNEDYRPGLKKSKFDMTLIGHSPFKVINCTKGKSKSTKSCSIPNWFSTQKLQHPKPVLYPEVAASQTSSLPRSCSIPNRFSTQKLQHPKPVLRTEVSASQTSSLPKSASIKNRFFTQKLHFTNQFFTQNF